MTTKRFLFPATFASAAIAHFLTASALAAIPPQITSRYSSADNTDTPIGVTDGNPLAATAIFSNSMYRQLGFDHNRPKHFGLSLNASYGEFSSGDIDNQKFATADLSGGTALFGIGTGSTISLGYRDTFGAKVYDFAFGIDAPIRIALFGLEWQVAPWALIGGSDGSDLSQGAIIGGIGATNLMGISFAHDKITLRMANQAAYFVGKPWSYSNSFNNEQDVSQILLKNGLEISARFFLHFEAYASITYTNFLNDAFIDSYFTPEVGLRFAGNHLVFAIAAFGDTADNYDSIGARATLAFNF